MRACFLRFVLYDLRCNNYIRLGAFAFGSFVIAQDVELLPSEASLVTRGVVLLEVLNDLGS
jgi:hypothetical protein